MTTNLKDYRWLRVGEIMLETDQQVSYFGDLVPVRPAMVGKPVLGSRSGHADDVLRLRKRRAAVKPPIIHDDWIRAAAEGKLGRKTP